MRDLLNKDNHEIIPDVLPVVPTMDVVVFPHMIVPLLVLDQKIINGINQTLEESKLILLLASTKKVNSIETISTKDLHSVGTIASIMRIIKIPEGGIKVLVQGICKATAKNVIANDERLMASVSRVEYSSEEDSDMITAQIREIKAISERLAGMGGPFGADFHLIVAKMQDPDKIIDFVLSHLELSVEQAQELLEKKTRREALETIQVHLTNEANMNELQEKIRNNARESMNQAQKEFYLREQLRAIKKELGEDDGEEIALMHEKLIVLHMDDAVKKEIKRHISRLERTAPESMEAAVTRNYLEWVFALPWGVHSEENLDIEHAKKMLDQDHYGLKNIKEHILDYISVRNLKRDGNSPILCFVGPPGVGKTSLGKSIARCLGRKYARISLGGVKDEAEIRGHRRTYVGAMPGRFIQAIRKAGSCNPLIVIDELDKIGSDFRGDPSAAMLELLDPQQNKAFYDNYLGVPFDLSNVVFLATANSLDSISGPLRDRLEIIQLSGYVLEEKMNIAKQYLISRGIKNSGLASKKIVLSDEILQDIIVNYTKEAGVRQLERVIRKLCSKTARHLVEKGEVINFTCENIETYLGPRKFLDEYSDDHDQIGITNGLAWTPYGGEIIKVEAVLMSGKGKLLLTGQLGNVMKESARAALSYARVHAKEFNISEKYFTNYDLHIHVPAGAVKKDGPSAGITMLTSILSALTRRPISTKYAMTGELNLRGDVMAIGGVKEKILAAKRNKVPRVIIPDKNKNDLAEVRELVKNEVEIILVKTAQEVLDHVLLDEIKLPTRVT